MTTSAENWRQRAQEARDLAAWVQDREVRQALLRIAEDYADKAREGDPDEAGAERIRPPRHRIRRARLGGGPGEQAAMRE